MDIVSPAVRSRMMAAIPARDTKPELTVRRLIHRLGYRYSLHGTDLPGRPDIVFPKRRKVIFVHGCFWHRHDSCAFAYDPKSRVEFWRQKFRANVERDARVLNELRGRGWEPLVIWECECRQTAQLAECLVGFLGAPRFGQLAGEA